jgi:hypothetical protein
MTQASIAAAETAVDDHCEMLARLQEELDRMLPSNPRRGALLDRMDEHRRKIDLLLDGVAGARAASIDTEIGEAVRKAA